MSRLIAIGDVHGMYESLRDLLGHIKPRKEDTLIFLGDYIDRGPASCKVLDLLIEIKDKKPFTPIFLCGNHEDMAFQASIGSPSNRSLWLMNGGTTTLREIGVDIWTSSKLLPTKYLSFIAGLSLIHQTDDYIFSHAGLRPGTSIEDQQKCDLLWIRDEWLRSTFSPDLRKVVHGHTISKKVDIRPNRICVDTGAYLTGILSAIDLSNMIVYNSVGGAIK